MAVRAPSEPNDREIRYAFEIKLLGLRLRASAFLGGSGLRMRQGQNIDPAARSI
jgi:hypothetical protein